MNEKHSKRKPMKRGQLAARTGCNPETIRYYEKIGLVPEPRRSGAGYRLYDETYERRLRFIMRGRELGFPVEDLRELLDLVDRRAVSCRDVEKLGEAQLKSVRDKIDDLKQIEKVLKDTVDACSGEDVPECPLIDTLFGVRG
ncbi:MAG: helix-turn-helix domain-containing protein [Pseudomonadales bacterium]